MRTRIETARLILRSPEVRDIPDMVCLLDDLRVSGNTSHIPYPYREADARDFVDRQARTRAGGQDFVYAVADGVTDRQVGAVGLHWRASSTGDGLPAWELGYWYGVPFWGQGYATEAGAALLREAEQALAPDHFVASHDIENRKSGHVLVKLGFDYTGVIRQTHSLARRTDMATRLMRRPAGAALPDPGRRP